MEHMPAIVVSLVVFLLSALVLLGAQVMGNGNPPPALAMTESLPEEQPAIPATPVEVSQKPSTTLDDWIITPSGLRYQELQPGKGASPQRGQTAVVHYVGTLANGQKFDSSYPSTAKTHPPNSPAYGSNGYFSAPAMPAIGPHHGRVN